MERFVIGQLAEWAGQANRKPLILRGARQVGKTWAVMELGRKHFQGRVHRVDLEQRPDWHGVFERNLSAPRILAELELLVGRRIEAGSDLLFLDEVQSCPRAVMALRYFHEQSPNLHVVAAGSLLEFAMQSISFPVGRVQFMEMHPMCFAEYLRAVGMDTMAEAVTGPPRAMAPEVHAALLEQVRRYLFVGGMPAAVLVHANTGAIAPAAAVHAELAHAFREDFAKYAPRADKACLARVFAASARAVGEQVKYSKLAEGYANSTIHRAFDLLATARLVRRIPSASVPELPLGASINPRRFKAVMADLGLMQHLCGVPADVEYGRPDLLAIHRGALAEQFVGQELVAAGQTDLCYWSREAKSSNAEVDYLAVARGEVLPIEVKSGPSGRLKSLHLLLQAHPRCRTGFVLSANSLALLPGQRLAFLPVYWAYSLGSGNTPACGT